MNSDSSKRTFFRQSGWMILATTVSGLFMYAVHIPAVARMRENEYAVFNTLLQVVNLMLIPGISLQTVFSKQAAAAQNESEKRALASAVGALLRWTFFLWIAAVGAIWFFQGTIAGTLRMNSPIALWVTIVIFLPTLWLPIMQGLLQGRQRFLWLGWTAILSGLGRFLTVLVTVVLLGGQAAGGMVAPLLGMTAALAVGMWQTGEIWKGPRLQFQWGPWLKQVIPLTLGLATSQIMFAADMIIVQSIFASDTGMYAAAGAIARGIVLFTGPVAMVMFPKIVRSTTTSEGAGLLGQALLATAVLGGGAALGCTLFPELPFRIMKPAYLPIAPLLPWFAWCMAPLTLSVVLINHLLARSKFRAVPWLLLVALCYIVTLPIVKRTFQTGDSLHDFKLVVQTLGGFNLLLLGIAAGFVWQSNDEVKN